MCEQADKEQIGLPSAYVPGNSAQPGKTGRGNCMVPDTQYPHPAALLGWDSDGVMDLDGKKDELRRGVELLKWAGVRLPEKQVDFT